MSVTATRIPLYANSSVPVFLPFHSGITQQRQGFLVERYKSLFRSEVFQIAIWEDNHGKSL